LFDNADNILKEFSGSIPSSSVNSYLIRVDCGNNAFLKADSTGDVTIEGRLAGSGDSFTDLESGSGLDLEPYAGTRQSFEIRITASSTSSRKTVAFDVYKEQ